MQLTTLITSTLFALTVSAAPWTKHSNGVWIANNNYYSIGGSKSIFQIPVSWLLLILLSGYVHEACTVMNTNTVVALGKSCAYWTDGNGSIFNGGRLFFALVGELSELRLLV